MKTRRSFVKGLLGFAGGLLVTTGFKASGEPKKDKSYSDFDTAEERIAFDTGMRAAIRAGKGPAPSLGWKCNLKSPYYPEGEFPLGVLVGIDFKNKIVIVDKSALA